MAGQLDGRVIAVVGASSGVGLDAARRFVTEGATVVFMARRKSLLDEVTVPLGEPAVPVTVDVADPESVRTAFGEIDRRLGRLDALLNVAGVARAVAIEDATDEDISYVTAINFTGPIFTTRSAIPLLRKAGGGDIVNVSSEITLDALPYMTLYGCTKGGLESFSRMMNQELKRDRIRVSTFVLGRTDTEFSLANIPPEKVQAMRADWDASGYPERISGKVGMDPAWVSDALVFLLTRPKGQILNLLHVRSFS